MSNEYTKLFKITDSLMGQEFNDVLFDFFKIEDMLKDPSKSHTANNRNYITIRLVTIIEQFCRKILEKQMGDNFKNTPEEIRINKSELFKIMDDDTNTNKSTKSNKQKLKTMIASSYSFQNVDQIKDNLKKYGIKKIFYDELKSDIQTLTTERHDTVHTVIDTDYDIEHGYEITKRLMMNILKKSEYENASIFHHIRGNYKIENKKYDDAIDCYDEAIELEPKDYELYYNKGITLGKLGKHGEAVKCYDEAIELEPKNYRVYYNNGITLGKLGKHGEAVKCYDEAIKLEPKDYRSYNNKGVILGGLGKHGEAVKCYDEAIELEPKNYRSYNNKGNALGGLGKHGEAVKCYDEAIELEPKNYELYYNKGVALDKLGKHGEAVKCFDKAIELEPKDYRVYYNKGVALDKLGKHGEAKKYFKKSDDLKNNIP